MMDFIEGEIDVLVSTTIIETGLDISNLKLCGVKQWTAKDEKYRYVVFFYKTNIFSGKLESSDEGNVFWIKKTDLNNYVLADGFLEMFEIFENDNLSENYYWYADNEWKVQNR